MKTRGWGKDYARLEQFFMQRLINITQDGTQNEMRYLVWQEVIDNNVTLPTDTVIHVWKDGDNFHDELARVSDKAIEMHCMTFFSRTVNTFQVTKFGYRTLLSSPWYLNYINYGVDWDRYYAVEPLSFNGTESQKRLVCISCRYHWIISE